VGDLIGVHVEIITPPAEGVDISFDSTFE